MAGHAEPISLAGMNPDPETPPPASLLDRPVARLMALAVALAAAAGLLALHRDDLFPPEQASTPAADDPFSRCLAQRSADIDRMLADGVIDDSQSARFKANAEALCWDQTRGNPPPPPSQ